MATVSNSGVSMSKGELALVIGAGFGLIGFLYYLGRKTVADAADAIGSAAQKAAEVAAPVVNAVNPASQTNAVQQVGTALYQMGDQKRSQQGLTLSTAIVDWFNWGGVNDYNPNADTPRG